MRIETDAAAVVVPQTIAGGGQFGALQGISRQSRKPCSSKSFVAVGHVPGVCQGHQRRRSR